MSFQGTMYPGQCVRWGKDRTNPFAAEDHQAGDAAFYGSGETGFS